MSQTITRTVTKPAPQDGVNVFNIEKNSTNWIQVLWVLHLFIFGFIGLYLVFYEALYSTVFFAIGATLVGTLGITAGAHRLWAHGSYQASVPLKIVLMLAQTVSGTGSIYTWVFFHRVHHKYFGTSNDPFNVNRGFLYSHLLSNLVWGVSEDDEIAQDIDMSDIKKDSVVMFQKRFYWVLMPILSQLLLINAPVEYWGENVYISMFVMGGLVHCITMNMSWLVNSATLIWGVLPGEKYPVDTNLVFILTKSYWPLYHYLAPWDYKTGEYGSYGSGCTTKFIQICEVLGCATDLQTMESNEVREALWKSNETGEPVESCLHEIAREKLSQKIIKKDL